MNTEIEDASLALAKYLDEPIEDIEEASYACYSAPTFDVGNRQYLVCTDEEADAAVTESIRESVWAFNPSFLSSMTDVPKEAFSSLVDQCESGNDWVLRLIEKTCGLEAFVDAAVSADGRGHFLSSYDGEENEQSGFYIYRVN